MRQSGRPGPRRFGVAVEVPDPHRSALAAARRASGDAAADDMAPHITLVAPVLLREPLSDVEPVVRSGAALVEPFEVHLRGTGTFRPMSEVVFVAVAAGIASLEQLAAALRVRPLDPPRPFPFHPHVTLAQDVPAQTLDQLYDRLSGFDARFTVDSLRLYEHDGRTRREGAGPRWHPVLDVALGAGGGVTRPVRPVPAGVPSPDVLAR